MCRKTKGLITMAEEKITNIDEILSEEQLEGVAGGDKLEIADDIYRIKYIGVLPEWTSEDPNKSATLLRETFKRYGVTAELNPNENEHNRYWINGNLVRPGEVWDHICDIKGIRNPFRR